MWTRGAVCVQTVVLVNSLAHFHVLLNILWVYFQCPLWVSKNADLGSVHFSEVSHVLVLW